MADQSNDAVVLLQYQTDQSSIATAVLAQTRVLDSLTAVSDAAQAAVLPLDSLATATTDLGQSGELIQGLNADLADTAAQAQAAVLPMEQLAQAAADAASGGGSGFSFGGARGALRAGGMLLGGAGGQDLRAIGQVATLTSFLGPLGTVAAVAAVAVHALTDAEQASEKGENSRIAVLKEVTTAVVTSTHDELKAHLQAAQTQLAIDQAIRDSLANTKIEVGNFARALVDVVIPQLDPEVQGKAAALKAALNEQDAALIGDQARIDAYTAAVNNNAGATLDAAVAANDAAVAEKTLTAARQQQNQNYLDEVTANAQAQAALFQTDQEIAATRVQASQDIATIEAKAADDRVLAVQNEAEAVAKIERDAGRQLATDVANRDAVAFVQAQQKESDQLDDQATALGKAEAQIQKSQDAQVALVRSGEEQKLEVLTEARAQEVDDVTNTANALVALSYNGALGVVSLHDQMWQGIEATTLRGIHSLINAVSTTFGLGVVETPGGSGTPFANGLNQIIDSRIYHTITGGGASAG